VKIGDLVRVVGHSDDLMGIIVRVRESFDYFQERSVTTYDCLGLDGEGFTATYAILEVVSENR